ncbi:unnamed protein product, partial [Meganyctiphanes norvegica]
MAPNSGEEFRQWRYWRAATVIGKVVMLTLLFAYTDGKILTTYKDEVIRYYALKPKKKSASRLYESDFTSQERLMLEDQYINPDKFDITLIDKLLRRLHPITGLAFHYEEVWTKDDPPGSNSNTEYLIFKIKFNRNTVCHEMPVMSETELESKLNELENLYIKLLDRVLREKGKPKDCIDKEIDKIKKEFSDLKNPIREPLTDKDIDLYKKEKKAFLKKLQAETVHISQQTLNEEYEDTCFTNPAAWLDLGEEFNMETDEVFTEIEVFEEDKNVHNKGIKVRTKIDYKEILKQETKNQKIPRVITITGAGGFGKSTTTKMFVCKWVKNKNCISGLDLVDILIFVQLKSLSNYEKSFKDLLDLRLKKVMTEIGLSIEKLVKIILSLNVLIILDGQDESSQNYLLWDILSLVSTPNKVRLLITTRPSASVDLQENILSSFTIPKLDLKFIGIAIQNQIPFITNYVKVMENNDLDRQQKIMQLVNRELPHLNSNMGEIMMSPLILSLLTILWVQGEILDSLTITEIFTKVNNILKRKLISRLRKKRIGIDLTKKIDTFEEYLQEIAYITFSHKEILFEEETVELLKKNILECGLGDVKDEILEHYLASTKYRKNLSVVVNYSYRHLRQQEYDASKYVIHVLSTKTGNISKIINQLKDDRYCNVRTHTIAIMADSYPHLLPQYGRAIIDHVEPGCMDVIDEYLHLILESKSNKTVINLVSDDMAHMRNFNDIRVWQVGTHSGVAALRDLIQIAQPELLNLFFESQSQPPALLASCLQAMQTYDMELKILLPHIPKGKACHPVNHNNCIFALAGPDVRPRLVMFAGCLGSAAIKQLPSTLETIFIHVTVAELPTLLERIKHLTQLEKIEIFMWCSDMENVTDLAQIQLPTNDGLTITVNLYGAEDADGHNIGILLQRFNTRLRRGGQDDLNLTLCDANITDVGVIQLLQTLRQEG